MVKSTKKRCLYMHHKYVIRGETKVVCRECDAFYGRLILNTRSEELIKREIREKGYYDGRAMKYEN